MDESKLHNLKLYVTISDSHKFLGLYETGTLGEDLIAYLACIESQNKGI